MNNLSNSIVGPGPDAMLIYKFDCNSIVGPGPDAMLIRL